MKLFLALITMTSVSFSSIAAQAFFVQANCVFNQATGQCSVFNSWSRPIFCRLTAQGQLYYGQWATVWQDAAIYPGMNAYVYVYAQNPYANPLVRVSGSAQCRF